MSVIEASVFHDIETKEYFTRFKTSVGNAVTPFSLPSTPSITQELDKLQQGIIRSISPNHLSGTGSVDSSIEFGKKLFQSLFVNDALDLYWEARQQLEQSNEINQRLIIKIHPTTYELARLPWELLYDPAAEGVIGFLAFNRRTPIIRFIADPPRRQLISDQQWRILLVSANPVGTDSLNLDRETEDIEKAFKGKAPDINLAVETLNSSSPSDFRERLRTFDPHILHFMGRGAPGRLLLDVPNKETRVAIYEDNLALTFNNITSLRLVFLNTCEMATAKSQENLGVAFALSRIGLPAVVANQFPALDDAAQAMSREFYRVLASGFPVDEALLWGRINVQGMRSGRRNPTLEWATPVIYLQADDGHLFRDLFQQAKTTQSGAHSLITETINLPFSAAAEAKKILKEIEHLEKLSEIHTRNLWVLQQQKATFGLHIPPHIITQLEDEEKDMVRVETQVSALRQKLISIATPQANPPEESSPPQNEAEKLEQWYGAAKQAMQTGDWAKATEFLQRIIKINKHYRGDVVLLQHMATLKTFLAATYEKAMLAYEVGDWEMAINEFQNILEKQSDNKEVSDKLDNAKLQLRRDGWYDESLAYIKRQEWDKAVELLSQIRTSEGRRRNLFNDLDYARAMQMYTQAKERAIYLSDHESDWASIIQLLMPLAKKDYRDAIIILKNAQNYANWLTHYRRGEHYLTDKKWKEAVQTFELITRESEEEYRDTAKQLQKAQVQLKLAKHYIQGKQHVEQKRWREARTEFQEIFKVDQNYEKVSILLEQTRIQIELADLYDKAQQEYNSGNLEEAIIILAKILVKTPDYRDDQAEIILMQWQTEQRVRQAYDEGAAHLEKREWQAAITAFEKLLELEPKGYRNTKVELEKAKQELRLETAYDQAKECIEQQQWGLALDKLKILQGLHQDYRDVATLIAEVEERQIKFLYQEANHWQTEEQWDKAATVLKKIRQLRPDDDTVRTQLDEVHQQKQIAEWYKTAIRAFNAAEWRKAIEFFQKIENKALEEYRKDLKLQYEQAKRNLKLEQLYEQAIFAFKEADWDNSEKLFEQITEIDSTYRDAQARLVEVRHQKLMIRLYENGQIALEEEDWQTAVESFKQVISIDAQYQDANQKLKQAEQAQRLAELYFKAEFAVANEQWPQAIDLYQSIVAEVENYRDAKDKLVQINRLFQMHNLYQSAIQSEEKENFDVALDFYQDILEIDPNFKNTAQKVQNLTQSMQLEDRYKKAKTAIVEQRYTDAASWLQSIMKERPDFKDAAQLLEKTEDEARLATLYKQGNTVYQEQKWVEAIQYFEQILNFTPNYPDVLAKLANANRQLRWDNLYRQAQIYLEEKAWPKAIATLNQVEPDQGYRQNLLLDLTYARAMQAYDQAHENLTEAKDSQTDWQMVIDLLTALISQYPSYRDAETVLQSTRRYAKWNQLYTKGYEQISSGKWKAAMETFGLINQENPQYHDAVHQLNEAKRQQALLEYYQRGVQYLDWRNWREACDEFKAVIELDPYYLDVKTLYDQAEAELKLIKLYSQAMRYYGENNPDAAIKTLAQVVEAASEYDDGQAILRLKEWRKEQDVRQAYEEGIRLVEQRQWQAAVEKLAGILDLEPKGFLDAAIQLERARLEARLQKLYNIADRLIHEEEWEQALTTLKDIQALRENYSDIPELIEKAEEEFWLITQYKQADQFSTANELDKAIAVLEGLARRKSDYQDVQKRLGELKHRRDLENWYAEAERAITQQEWAKALHALQTIKDLGEEGYRDVKNLYQLAERNQHLANLYAEANAAIVDTNLDKAEELLESIDLDYLDVRVKLFAIRRQKRLLELNRKAQIAFNEEKWNEAIESYRQIVDMDPSYEDAVERLKQVERLKGLSSFYQSAEDAMAEKNWAQAIRSYEAIQTQVANYKDVQAKLDQAYQQHQIEIYQQNAVLDEEKGDLVGALEQYQEIFKLDPRFDNIVEKIREITQAMKLATLYREALTALEAQNFIEGISKLQQLIAQDAEYKNASAQLKEGIKDHKAALLSKYQHAEKLEKEKNYQESHKLYKEFQWEKDNSPWL